MRLVTVLRDEAAHELAPDEMPASRHGGAASAKAADLPRRGLIRKFAIPFRRAVLPSAGLPDIGRCLEGRGGAAPGDGEFRFACGIAQHAAPVEAEDFA